MLLAEALLFLTLKASTMIMKNETIFYTDVLKARFDGTLAPIILFSIAASKRGGIKGPDAVERRTGHGHAEADSRGYIGI